MSMSNAAETALLEIIFKNTNWANVGDATGLRGASTAGSLYVALHSADPGEAGDQTTSELSYTGYARVGVVRSGSGWTVSGNTVSNAALVTFGACTGGPVTATHFSVGVASSSTSQIIVSGSLTASLSITASPSITPEFAIGALTATAD